MVTTIATNLACPLCQAPLWTESPDSELDNRGDGELRLFGLEAAMTQAHYLKHIAEALDNIAMNLRPKA